MQSLVGGRKEVWKTARGRLGDLMEWRLAVHGLEEPEVGLTLVRQTGNEVEGVRAEEARGNSVAVECGLAEVDGFASGGRRDGRFPLPDIAGAYQVGAKTDSNFLTLLEWDGLEPGEEDLGIDGVGSAGS